MVKTGHRKLDIQLVWVLCTFLLACVLSGCGGKPVWLRDDPAAVVQGYLVSLDSQSPEIAWEFLSSTTRRKLEARAESFNMLDGHGASHEPWQMLRLGHVMSTTREYKKITLKSSDGSQAVVEIVLQDDSAIPVTLYREEQRWAVDLPLN